MSNHNMQTVSNDTTSVATPVRPPGDAADTNININLSSRSVDSSSHPCTDNIKYPHTLPADFPLDSPLDPMDVTEYCLNEFLPSGTTPHHFQVEATKDITFDGKNIFLIRKTGEGKSVVPMASAAMLRGFTIILVPLIGLGSDQVSKNFLRRKRVEAYHLDEFKGEDYQLIKQVMLKMIGGSQTSKPSKCILLYASPNALKDGSRYNDLFIKMVENGLLSLFCIDEAHSVVMQGREFRKEFQHAISNISIIIKRSRVKVPIIVMTGSLRKKHRVELDKLLELDGKYKLIKGNMGRRSISITVSFEAQTARAIKTKLTNAFNEESSPDTVKKKGPPTSKKIIYCSSKAAAEGTLSFGSRR